MELSIKDIINPFSMNRCYKASNKLAASRNMSSATDLPDIIRSFCDTVSTAVDM
jgi:hypothetical protein